MKNWYESKTIVSGAVAILTAALGYFGYSISPEDQEALIVAVMAAAGGLCGIGAIYGRIKAVGQIK